jgi:hypothetical protein
MVFSSEDKNLLQYKQLFLSTTNFFTQRFEGVINWTIQC